MVLTEVPPVLYMGFMALVCVRKDGKHKDGRHNITPFNVLSNPSF
jgi:hypothetical protein